MRTFGRLLRFEDGSNEIYVSHETVLHACSCCDDGILQDPRFRQRAMLKTASTEPGCSEGGPICRFTVLWKELRGDPGSAILGLLLPAFSVAPSQARRQDPGSSPPRSFMNSHYLRGPFQPIADICMRRANNLLTTTGPDPLWVVYQLRHTLPETSPCMRPGSSLLLCSVLSSCLLHSATTSAARRTRLSVPASDYCAASFRALWLGGLCSVGNGRTNKSCNADLKCNIYMPHTSFTIYSGTVRRHGYRHSPYAEHA
jgi:hypothetical protein